MKKNVGTNHNDLHARLGSLLAMTFLMVISLPLIDFDPAKYRIALLYISILGCSGLALGLVFGRKNLAAGMCSSIIPFLIYNFPEDIQRTGGLITIILSMSYLTYTVLKRKCIINWLLHINSYVD